MPIQMLWIYYESAPSSVVKLQYNIYCKIKLHSSNKLPLQYCEISTKIFSVALLNIPISIYLKQGISISFALLNIFVILQYFNGFLLTKCNVKLQSRYCKVKSQYLESNFSKCQFQDCEFTMNRRHHQLWNYNIISTVKLNCIPVINFHYSIVKLQQKFFSVALLLIPIISKAKNFNILCTVKNVCDFTIL